MDKASVKSSNLIVIIALFFLGSLPHIAAHANSIQQKAANTTSPVSVSYYRITRDYPGWWYGPRRTVHHGWKNSQNPIRCQKSCLLNQYGVALRCSKRCHY